MSMDLGELMRAVVRLQVLNNSKLELVLKVSELETKRVVAVTLRTHLLDQHWGPGHKPAHRLEQQVDQLEQELAPHRSELESINSQIKQIYAEMKAKNYDASG